jgi:hypothetical protein
LAAKTRFINLIASFEVDGDREKPGFLDLVLEAKTLAIIASSFLIVLCREAQQKPAKTQLLELSKKHHPRSECHLLV